MKIIRRSCALVLCWISANLLGAVEARGSIVYYDIADLHIALDCLAGPPSEPPSASLDIDGDSVDDIVFSAGLSLPPIEGDPHYEVTYVSMLGLNRVAGESWVSFLTEGDQISASLAPPLAWLGGSDIRLHRGEYDITNPVPCGVDFSGFTGFVGIEFEISGNTHYGWLRMTLHPDTGAAILRDYAYESEPGVGIIAGAIPEPSTILLAGLGGLALLWRARKKIALIDC